MMSVQPPVLVLGIGNILLSDEGIGVRVVEAMHGLPLPEEVELIDGGTGGADLVELLAGRRKVIVVDAMQAGAEPGTVLRMTAEDLLPAEGKAMSLHELGLLESLRMATLLGCAPQSVIVLGVQPGSLAPGLDLSPEVAAAVPRVIAAVMIEVAP